MTFKDIGGKKVHIDSDSHSAHVAAEYLAANPDNARAIFDEAHHNIQNNYAHFEIPKSEHPLDSHHFTLTHNPTDGTYSLRIRHGF